MSERPEPTTLPCILCDYEVTSPHLGGVWLDGQRIDCPSCGVTNVVSSDAALFVVHFSHYICAHGRHSDIECMDCEAQAEPYDDDDDLEPDDGRDELGGDFCPVCGARDPVAVECGCGTGSDAA